MIKDEKIDKELQEAGVKFLPFVGDNYEHGISFDEEGNLVLGTEENPGKKVLVLGESHYCDEGCCDCGNFRLHEECAEFTRNVINDYLDESKERQNWMRTFVKFERALANADTNIDSNSIWNHLMFYNYLQISLCSARKVGTQADYENAIAPFYKVIEIYKPDCIMVWGRRLYNNLPTKDIKCFDLSSDIEIMEYNFEGNKIFVVPMCHPSSCFFSRDLWHNNIVVFLKNCLYGRL